MRLKAKLPQTVHKRRCCSWTTPLQHLLVPNNILRPTSKHPKKRQKNNALANVVAPQHYYNILLSGYKTRCPATTNALLCIFDVVKPYTPHKNA